LDRMMIMLVASPQAPAIRDALKWVSKCRRPTLWGHLIPIRDAARRLQS
jgi:hypothetical protein